MDFQRLTAPNSNLQLTLIQILDILAKITIQDIGYY